LEKFHGTFWTPVGRWLGKERLSSTQTNGEETNIVAREPDHAVFRWKHELDHRLGSEERCGRIATAIRRESVVRKIKKTFGSLLVAQKSTEETSRCPLHVVDYVAGGASKSIKDPTSSIRRHQLIQYEVVRNHGIPTDSNIG